MKIDMPDEAIAHIAKWEGERLRAYQCSASVWTIGIGATRYPPGGPLPPGPVKQGDRITTAQSREIFRIHIGGFASDVRKALDGAVDLNPYKFGICVSLAFNIGINGFRSPNNSVRLATLAGDDEAAIAGLRRYVKARNRKTGQLVTIQGLVNRREASVRLYTKPWVIPKPPVSYRDAMDIPLRPIAEFPVKSSDDRIREMLDKLNLPDPPMDYALYELITDEEVLIC